MTYGRLILIPVLSFVSTLLLAGAFVPEFSLSALLISVLVALGVSAGLAYAYDILPGYRDYIHVLVAILVIAAPVANVCSYTSGGGAVFGTLATFPFDDELDVYEDMCLFLSGNPTHDEVKQKALKYISYYAYCKDRPIDFCPTVKSAAQNLTSLYQGEKTVEELKDTWCISPTPTPTPQPEVIFEITGVQAVTATAGAIAIAGLVLYYVRYLK